MGHTVEQRCCDSGTFWLYLFVIVGLLLFSGLMSGLTLGLMSLGLVDLEVIKRSGKPEERKHAEKIAPVVRRQHLLLVTLLVGNAMAMEALPLFLDSLVDTWMAIVLSVTLLLMFGEILPQAVCSRYGLAVGAAMAPVVRVLLIIMFPIAWPVSKLLDKLLGDKHHGLFGRAELKTLVDMHGNEAGNGGELSRHETRIIGGALELAEKYAGHAMTPISAIVSIDVQSKLDEKTMMSILSSGYSRIPVYFGKPNNIIGLILVKNLLHVAMEKSSKFPFVDVLITKIPWIEEDMPLYDVLHAFQQGQNNMAAVVRSTSSSSPVQEKVLNNHAAIDDVTNDGTESGFIFKRAEEERLSDKGGALGFGIVHRQAASWAENYEEPEGDIVGIITREDVLDELLKEDIVHDSTDCKVPIVDEELNTSLGSFWELESPGSSVHASKFSLPPLPCHYNTPTVPAGPAFQLSPRVPSMDCSASLPNISPDVSPLSNASAASPLPTLIFPDSATNSFCDSPEVDNASTDSTNKPVWALPPTSSSAPSSPIRIRGGLGAKLGAKRGARSMNGRNPMWKEKGLTSLSTLTSRVLMHGQESPRPISRQVAVHRILHSKE